MSANLSCVYGAGAQLFTNQGVVLAGGKIYTYLAGSTTPATTWTDATATVANSNPIILDSAGRPPQEVWLTSGKTYKFVVKTSDNVTITTYDYIPGVNDTAFTYTNVLTYGADPTGVTASDAAFANAWSAIKYTGGTLLIPPGTYQLNSQWLVDIDTSNPHNYEILGYGAVLLAGPAVTGFAMQITNSYNLNFGLKVEGLAFDHRSNATVGGCILARNTAALRLIKCSAEMSKTKDGWAFAQLENKTPGVGDTGCFWTLFDQCAMRPRAGEDLIVGKTTATTQLTLNSDQMVVAATTVPIEVGMVVADFSASGFGGQDFLFNGTMIVAQVSGTPGGAGTYKLSSVSTGTTTTDTVTFSKYSTYGIRLVGEQNATKIVNCAFTSLVDAVRLDVDPASPQPVHANGVRIERNDFEGVNNAIKVNCDAPAFIMPTGLLCSHNRCESGYSYFNIGSNTQCIPNAASFTGSIPAGSNILTASAVTGTIAAGSTIVGAGVLNPSVVLPYGTSGTTGVGGAGTYALSLAHSVAVSGVAMTISGVKTLANHSNPPVIGPDYTVTGSSPNYLLNPNYQIVYGMQSTYYGNAYSQVGGPSDYTVIVDNNQGGTPNFVVKTLSDASAWNAAHLVLGQQHYWTDGNGALRTKNAQPQYDSDGVLVASQGTQTSLPTMENLFPNPWFDLYGPNDPTVGPPVSVSSAGTIAVTDAGPSACPNNPTGQVCKITSVGTTISNGLIIPFSAADQLTNNDYISCGMWVYSPSLTTQLAVIYYDTNGTDPNSVATNTTAATWQYITWTMQVKIKANAKIYVGVANGAVFTASVPYNSDVMTVTAIIAGSISVGAALLGAGVLNGTTISSQLTGTAGSTGTYKLSSVQGTAIASSNLSAVTSYANAKVVYVGGFTYVAGRVPPQTVTDTFGREAYIFSGAGAPAYKPAYIGQRYYDTGTGGHWYMAKGTATAADWVAIS